MKILSLLLCLFPITAFGQATAVVNTNDDVLHWLDSIKTLPLTAQLNAINQRAIRDTNTYVHHRMYHCSLVKLDSSAYKVPAIENKTEVSCKPTYLVGGYFFMDNNTNMREELLKFQEVLGKAKIDTVLVLH